jgi:predicted glycosyltransferase
VDGGVVSEEVEGSGGTDDEEGESLLGDVVDGAEEEEDDEEDDEEYGKAIEDFEEGFIVQTNPDFTSLIAGYDFTSRRDAVFVL